MTGMPVQNVPEYSSSAGVSQEWLERYMDSAKFVSDEQIQDIWGKILAKEFEAPGTTPRNITRILCEISPTCAKAFRSICGMRRTVVVIDDNGKVLSSAEGIVVPVTNDSTDFQTIGIPFEVFNELDSAGLIKFDWANGYVLKFAPEQKGSSRILTYTEGVTREITKFGVKGIPTGCVLLTKAGECLERITERTAISSFEQLEHQYMLKKHVEYQDMTEYQIDFDKDGNLSLKKNGSV